MTRTRSHASLREMRAAVQECRGCDLYKNATQAVFGAGPDTAIVMFVGEQPGNEEDIKGAPFVGPAGRILEKALNESGIDRAQAYVTNVVKHFKFEERGKRRIHKKPDSSQIEACRPWLEGEIQAVRPRVIVCLGATAAQALLGRTFRLTQHRGEFFQHEWAPGVIATVHPSSILRAPDETRRQAAYRAFVDDLKVIKARLEARGRQSIP